MSDLPIRYFIITPYRHDYKAMCEKHGLPYMCGSGIDGIYWIDTPEKLYGHKIYSQDRIIFGDQYICFGERDMKRIETEIHIRKQK